MAHRHRRVAPAVPFTAGWRPTDAPSPVRADPAPSPGAFASRPPWPGGRSAPVRQRGGEDLDIFLTMLQAGHTLVYQPSARIAHRSHADYPGLRRQLFGYGVGLAAALTKRFVTCPSDRRAMLTTAATAARYLLSPGSPKNRGRTSSYPRALVAVEFLGVLLGPPSYLRSRVGRALARR